MEKEGHFTDKFSYILALVSLLASFYIFFQQTGQLGGSIAAAVLTAGLVWATYIMLRWLLLANRE
ncbi:MAG: hypothetical protein LLG04_18095 [Parachlamydia sp.]|nr:hypothetical protein [Parachlamydia sp.]